MKTSPNPVRKAKVNVTQVRVYVAPSGVLRPKPPIPVPHPVFEEDQCGRMVFVGYLYAPVERDRQAA